MKGGLGLRQLLNASLLLEKLKSWYRPFEPAILSDSAQREEGDAAVDVVISRDNPSKDCW